MVRDVTDADFATLVVERSRERPVVVDFWATWCAPCRQLSPLLERVGAEHEAAVDTLKINVDANPVTAGSMQIRSIPTVVAFRDGVPVDAFLGAQPEQAVRDFYRRLAAAEEPLPDDEESLRSMLERDPGNRRVILALAPLIEPAEARALLARIPEDSETRRIAAEIALRSADQDDAPEVVRRARKLAGTGAHDEALRALLDVIRDEPEARPAMLEIFAVLGDEHPLTMRYRRELANALF